MADIRESGDETGSIVALMSRAQSGDRVAFDELQAIGRARGISYTEGWLESMILFRLQDRAAGKNLLAREGIKDELAATIADLTASADGPIERLIVRRAALSLVDAELADHEHLTSMRTANHPSAIEALDRRRDRAHRRLLVTLRALCEVRRMNRPSIQVNIGDGNPNFIKA